MKNWQAVTIGVAALVLSGMTGCSSNQTVSGTASPVATSAPSADDGRSVASYFKVGDCIAEAPHSGDNVTIVECSEPHAREVFGVYMLPDGPFPGKAAIQEVKNRCAKGHLADYSATAADDPSLKTSARFPDENSWGMGDRSVTCLVGSDSPRTGSVRDR